MNGTPDDVSAPHAHDRSALAFLDRANTRLRALLCTLARRGVALRHDEPDRARQLLAALAPWPLFKGGQFLFDLLEWEDFMLDGDPPPAVPESDLAARLDPALRWLLATVTADSDDRPTSPLRHAAAAVDLPVRWLAATVRSVADGTLRDLTQLLSGLAGRDTDGVESLPPLESGFYLYQDVVLGLFDFLGPRLPDTIPGPRTHRHQTTPARTGNTTRKEPT